MVGVNEAAAGSGGAPLSSALASGVGAISQNQTVTFTRYLRVILPLDGFAFWVRADAIVPGSVTTPAATQVVKGSLHYNTDNLQDESEGFSINRVVFTSEDEIELLNEQNPKSLFIGEFDGLKFAFSKRTMLYRQAGLFHYQGDAVYPSMQTQIIDSFDGVDLWNVIVSNSLPVWLTLNRFCPMYPSYLVPEDIYPSWCSVHIPPEATTALQASPYIDSTGSHYQLCQDRVKLTFFGLRNSEILNFIDYINEFSLNTDAIGIMNMPVVRDEKRTQAELNTLAMKKTIEYEVSYYQSTVRDVARQYIKSAFITIYSQ